MKKLMVLLFLALPCGLIADNTGGNAWNTNTGGVGAGTITGVTAGTAITGGGTNGTVTVNVDTTQVATLSSSPTWTGSNTFTSTLTATNAANSIGGNGSALTSLNGSNVGSGTVADARLSANVALINGSPTWTGTHTFSGGAASFYQAIVSTSGVTASTSNISAVNNLLGQSISSATAMANTAATTVFGNQGQVTLPSSGTWSAFGGCDISLNGSVTTAAAIAISAFSGNTTTDHVTGDNQFMMLPPTAAADVSETVAGWTRYQAANTVLFIKVKATFSAGNPQAACRITAIRVQ